MTTCPTCGGYLRPADDGTKKFLICLRCGTSQIVDAFTVPVTPVKRTETPLEAPESGFASEAELVTAIVSALRQRGFLVLRVGQYRADLAGQTPGTPDLFVRGVTWPVRALWLGLEVKNQSGLSDAQQVLLAQGAIQVARSVEEACAIAESYQPVSGLCDTNAIK